MGYLWYLLIPFSPFLAVICLIVFAYERLALNERESLDNGHLASWLICKSWDIVSVILSYPAGILGPFGGLIRWPVFLFLSPILGVWKLVRLLVLDPLFKQIVPSLYFSWNNRVYRDLREDLLQIRVLEVLPGSWMDPLVTKLEPVDLVKEDHETPYEALSYSWGGHLILRRSISINDHSYFVADTVFNALKELRDPH